MMDMDIYDMDIYDRFIDRFQDLRKVMNLTVSKTKV